MKAFLPLLTLATFFGLAWFLTPSPETPLADPGKAAHSSRSSLSQNQSSPHRRISTIARKATYEEQANQVIALASSIPISEIKDWQTNTYFNSLDGDLESLFWSITSERWLEANPEEYLTWSAKMKFRRHDFYLAKWAGQDPAGAVSFLKKSPSTKLPWQLYSVFKNLAKTNSAAAFEIAAKLLPSTPNDQQLDYSFASLAKIDPERTLALRDSLPPSARFKLTTAVAGTLLETDFTRALQLIDKEKSGWMGLMAATNSGSYYEGRDALIKNARSLPEGWLEKLAMTKPGLLVHRNSLAMLESSPAELGISEAAYQKLLTEAQNSSHNKKLRPKLMGMINGTDLPLETRQAFLSGQIARWDRDDSSGLRTWLGQIDDPSLHETADQALAAFDERSIAPVVANQDPASMVRDLPRANYDSLAKIPKWTKAESAQAIAAFQNLSQEDQAATFKSLSQNLSYHPYGNRQFYAAVFQHRANQPLPENPNQKNEIVGDIANFASTWAGEEPAKAAAWATQLPAGPSREWSLKNVARTWRGYSESEAQSWVQTLPTSDQTVVKEFLHTNEKD